MLRFNFAAVVKGFFKTSRRKARSVVMVVALGRPQRRLGTVSPVSSCNLMILGTVMLGSDKLRAISRCDLLVLVDKAMIRWRISWLISLVFTIICDTQ